MLITEFAPAQLRTAQNLINATNTLYRKMVRAGLVDSQMLYGMAAAREIVRGNAVTTDEIKNVSDQVLRLADWMDRYRD